MKFAHDAIATAIASDVVQVMAPRTSEQTVNSQNRPTGRGFS
jgi:hypothetical protein